MTYTLSPTDNIIEKLNALKTGDVAIIPGGVYKLGKTGDVQIRLDNLSGVTIQGSNVVFDLSDAVITGGYCYGFLLNNCHDVTIKGIRVTNLKQPANGWPLFGWVNQNCTGLRISVCEVDNIGGQGFFDSNSNGTYYLNCDSHHNADPFSRTPYNGSNGFSVTGGSTSTNITYDGCRAWLNSDDGWDFYGVDGNFTIKNSWSFWNGYIPGKVVVGDGSGFKLGPTSTKLGLVRTLTGNLAFENVAKGFDQNNANCEMLIANNTSYKNGVGFSFGYNLNTLINSKNNISFDETPYAGDNVKGTNNSWNGLAPTALDFKSLSSLGCDGKRGADGSLPILPFMRLATAKLAGLGAYPDFAVTSEKVTKWKGHVYSDGTMSTAKAVNLKKNWIGDVIRYTDNTTEFKTN